MLSNIPQLKAIFKENEDKLAFMDKFVGKCEAELCKNLRENQLPDISLVEAIAVAKVRVFHEPPFARRRCPGLLALVKHGARLPTSKTSKLTGAGCDGGGESADML